MSYLIRKATEHDVPGMMQLVRELAEFERAPGEVVTNEATLLRDGFGPNAIYKAFVAEEADTNRIIGMALYYTAYSTWKGRMLFLDDLIVTQSYRGLGIGRRLMDEFLREAQREGVKQVRWQVLNWNTPAIGFYRTLGAFLDEEWITCKMSDEQINKYFHKNTSQ
ncbi:MAG: GNAT family N-acetyltransferase [Chitinophagales bacterium]|nr:GNAT family N-acetyltransferase [Chitinophagales bacterium]MDW8420026.1 GNAT family N-acetyltransferase [Chitinophagales bacterium]